MADNPPFQPRWSDPVSQGAVRHEDTFDVDLRVEPRRPIETSTPGGDVVVEPGPYDRRLVALGDSLTQGFHHFAIHDTDISWPAMVAIRLGLTVGSDAASGFRVPAFPEPGGYPLNLEGVLDRDHGNLGSVGHILEYLEDVKKAYAPTAEAVLPGAESAPNDNLAVWGWDLRDLLERTVDTELGIMRQPPAGGFAAAMHRFGGSLVHEIDHPDNRSAITVLAEPSDEAPDANTRTALQLAAARGRIETLVVWMGANNALPSVIRFAIVPSKDDGYRDLTKKADYTVWTPTHFESELRLLEDEVARIDAAHVIWATVPHLTIPPLAHGVDAGGFGGRLTENPRYFRYYTQPWLDHEFTSVDPHLTGWDAWLIDSVIDEYNAAIVAMVERQRVEHGKDWRLVDMCAVLDRLAYRRQDAEGGKSYPYLPPYVLPELYARNGYDTRFLAVDPHTTAVTAGGLIGLDGIHPTTAAYGLVASEFMKEMRRAGVVFDPDDPAAVPEPAWEDILAADSLLQNPPRHIDAALDLLGTVEHEWDMVKGVWRR